MSAKLDIHDIELIFQLRVEYGLSCSELADKFDVSVRTVERVISRKSHRWVPVDLDLILMAQRDPQLTAEEVYSAFWLRVEEGESHAVIGLRLNVSENYICQLLLRRFRRDVIVPARWVESCAIGSGITPAPKWLKSERIK